MIRCIRVKKYVQYYRVIVCVVGGRQFIFTAVDRKSSYSIWSFAYFSFCVAFV